MNSVKIGNRLIGKGKPVFIIAEAGINHNGDVKLAMRMIDGALKAGADAVKFQSFRTGDVMTKRAPGAKYHRKAAESGESWFDLLKRSELSEKDHHALLKYCEKKGIIFFSTPYDTASADLLNKLGVPAVKIASTDLNNIPLLERVRSYGKPVLLATGMATLAEIRESVGILRQNFDKIILFQCTANYPPDPADANLNVIEALEKEFGLPVGYSDHIACKEAAVAAVAKGACAYEVHYTLSRKLPGPDQKSSLEPAELKDIVSSIRLTEKLLGSYHKDVTPSERETRLRLRKSIVANEDIRKGDVFTYRNVAIKRPGNGLPPKNLYSIIGKTAKNRIPKDALIRLRDLGR